MQKKYRIVCLVLTLIILLTTLFGVVSYAGEEPSYDYSKDGSPYNRVFTSADILEEYLGEPLSVAERNYLISFGGSSVSYNDGITTAFVNASFEDGRLSVVAYEYVYRAKNGMNVTWRPQTVRLMENEKGFTRSNGAYCAEFYGIDEDSVTPYVSVEYILEITVCKDDVNRLLNKAFYDVALIEREIESGKKAYETALEEYNAALRSYADYVQAKSEYDKQLSEYNAYLNSYRLYKESLDAYKEYLLDLKQYEIAKAERERYEKELLQYKSDYSKYVDYMVKKKDYDEKRAKYNLYLDKISKFRGCLEIIDYTDIEMTDLNRSLRAAVYGSVVDTVLRERETLESGLVGAPAGVIDLAGEATNLLRSLLNNYFNYTTEQGRYSYYLEHYELFKKAFVDLFIALDHLYDNQSVCAVLYETEKDEKYRILLAQLYLVAHAISDEPIRSVPKELVVGGKGADRYKEFTYTNDYTIDIYEYKVSDILGEENLLPDQNSATPENEAFPVERSAPIEPDEVQAPNEPVYAPAPMEVAPVPEPPKEPTEVMNPGKEPIEIPAPTEKPTEYLPPSEYLDLLSEKENIAKRNSLAQTDICITLRKNVHKKFIDPDEVNVKFYSHIDSKLLYETTVDYGTAVNYEGEIPFKTEDEGATYSFDGWQTDKGVSVDLAAVTSDLDLYPRFVSHTKSYEVSFVVDGVTHAQTFEYGQMPFYNGGTPVKKDSDTCYFTFEGWDKELSPVTSDQTYTALFCSRYIVPTSGSGAKVYFDGENFIVDMGICFDQTFDLGEILRRARSVGGVTVVSPYCRLYISYSKVGELYSLGVSRITVQITESVGDVRNYLVTLFDENGRKVNDASVKICDVSVPFLFNSRLKLFYLDGDERKYSKFSVNDKSLEFNAVSGVEYCLAYEYVLSPLANLQAVISSERNVYSSGESVALSLDLPYGYKLTGLYYLDGEGKRVDLKVLRFTMPECDTTVIAEVSPIKFKITFVSGEVPLAVRMYDVGEIPVPPEAPSRMSSDKYDYTFVGWSEEITSVTEDKVYYAVFEQTERTVPEPIPSPSLWDRICSFFLELFIEIIRFFISLFGN